MPGPHLSMPCTVEIWKSATTDPGLEPRLEADMTDLAVGAWNSWWLGKGPPHFIAREVVGPHGIADLVAVQFDAQALCARSEAGLSPVPDLTALRAIEACRRTSRSAPDLAATLGLTISGVRRAVKVAHDAGALDMTGGNRYRTNSAWSRCVRRLVAVELKRSDWQRAANQLWAYRQWASATWLVLGQRPPLKALEDLRETGAGLAYLDVNAEIRVVLRPKRSRKIAGIASVWAGEQALAQAIDADSDSIDPATVRRATARSEDELALLAG